MKLQSKLLTKEDISLLLSWGEPIVIQNDFDFVYEKQIPILAIALLEGKIEVIKKSKVIETILSATLLGVHQLLNSEKVKRGFRIKADSKIVMISKSELLEALKIPGSKLVQLIT